MKLNSQIFWGYLTKDEQEQIKAYIADNGLDITSMSEIFWDDSQISFVMFLYNDDGQRYIDPMGSRGVPATHTITTPLIIPLPQPIERHLRQFWEGRGIS